MKRDEYKVFSEGRIAHLAVRNRLIRSATYECGMTEDGRVTSEILNLYRTLADGGVGTIITGHMAHQACTRLALVGPHLGEQRVA